MLRLLRRIAVLTAEIMRRILLWLTRFLMSVSLAALAQRAALLVLFLRLTASMLSTLTLASTAALVPVFAL